MNKFFIWCSGADTQTVLKCNSSEVNKYQNIGMVVFFVALLASLSASYFVAFAFDKSSTPSLALPYIFVGLLWGFIILSLDRSIVATISKDDSLKDQLIKASPRFVIAIFIGLVISTPLEMKIFQKEINQELRVITFNDKKAGVDILINEKKRLLSDYKKDLESLKHDLNFKYMKFQDELKGSVTGQVGYGKKAREYEVAYLQADSSLKLKSTSVDVLQRDINILNETIGTVLDITDDEVGLYAGVEKRVQALYSLNSFHWVITCLFILFEILPMIVKLLSPKGDYDALLKKQKEEFQLQIIQEYNYRSQLSEEKEKLTLEKQIIQEKSKNKIETELKNKILSTLSEVQNEIATARIESFRKKSLESLIENIPPSHSLAPTPYSVENIGLKPEPNPFILNQSSSHIVNKELEEILWRGDFVNAMNTQFVFHSDPKKDSKKLFHKLGSIEQKSSAWCYSGSKIDCIEIMQNGIISEYNYSIQNESLYLKSVKNNSEEYSFSKA
ncbi:DUF4407 domain-containing protein [Sphingobacterium faecium]